LTQHQTSQPELSDLDREALARIKSVQPIADPLTHLPDVPPSRIPRHIAIIMDGNGRWARQRGFPREFGHRNGAATIRTIMTECERIGVEVLTLYSFSLENWRRPDREVAELMRLCCTYCDGERESMKRRNVRCRVIGRRDGLPPEVLASINAMEETTRECTGSKLCLAINYGGRAELVDACRSLAARAARGEIDPASIDESAIESSLGTSGLPEPDMLVRTGGELRISNFLLWQISYAEIYVTDALWPDFGVAELHAAVREFARRRRRFGGLDQDEPATDGGHQPHA
jgi:undecaprenyl diphosphate synthase